MDGLRKVFKRIRHMLAAMAAGTLFFSAAPAAMAMDEIMPLEELEPGMTGELYTVVDPSGDIRSFEVTILGVMRNGKSMPFIVARSEGAFADTEGGLMQGMSGSPVYIDGRLVGAGSATLKEMNPHTFLITPIEEMIKIWDMPDTKNQRPPQDVDVKKDEEKKAAPEEKAVKPEDSGKKPETSGKDAKDGKDTKKDEPKKPETSGKPSDDKKEQADKKDAKDIKDTKEKKDEDKKQETKTEDKKQAADYGEAPKDTRKKAEDGKTGTTSSVGSGKNSEAKEQDAKDGETPKDTNRKSEDGNTGTTSSVGAGKYGEPRKQNAKDGGTPKDTSKNAENGTTSSVGSGKADAEKQEKSLVYAAGFGEAGMKFLEKQLSALGYSASSFSGLSGTSYSTDYDAKLYPGSPVGAALAYGDFSLAATGTVTAVEDDGRVLAFGHSFLHRGNVNYFMTDASVFAMVNGMTDGMKLSTTGNIIGRISQDRMAGIAGTVGTFPEVVPIRLTVEDKTLGRTSSYAATMAYDEAFVPVLTQAISYAALGRTVDSQSESTVKVNFAIRTDAAEDGLFKRSNLFYAAADTGQIAFAELVQALALIAGDQKSEAGLYDIKVNITSEAKRRTASLVSATPDKPKAKPGEKVNIKVTFQPYREQPVTVDVPFTVPKMQRDGAMHLDVHGGGLVSLDKLLAAAQSEMGVVTPDNQEQSKSTKERLHDMGEADANYEIVIEPGAGPVLSEKEQKKQIEEAIRRQEEMQARGEKPDDGKPPKAKLATDYVIENVIHTAIEVSRKEK